MFGKISDAYRDEYEQLLELRKGYRIMQLRDDSHSFSWDELCQWIDEADERMAELEKMSRVYNFSVQIDNLNQKWGI